MTRRLSLLAASAFLVAGLMAATIDATFVLKGGERHSGQLVYHHKDTVGLIINGQERQFPFDDLALISFGSVNPTRQEIEALPSSDNPPELERHMLVLRNGQMLKGKLHDFIDDQVSYDVRSDSGTVDRRRIPLNQVARLYLSAPSSRSLFGNLLSSPSGVAPASTGASNRTVRVEANRPWTDTGLDVRAGTMVSFNANGTIQIRPDKDSGPDGSDERATRRTIPVRDMNVGGLIARVGQNAFAVGSNTQPIRMPANGRLFLGVNDDELTDNSGAFEVTVSRR